MTELKPCPFCGNNQAFIETEYYGLFVVKCGYCHIRTAVEQVKEKAIEAWNRRADE